MNRSGKQINRHPNIVYILADDLGYGDLSCLNPESRIRTPYLDRLASEGMRFTDAHASSAVCTPSRYSILTGRYCWRSKLKSGVVNGYATPVIEEGRMTVASVLRDSGYSTACIGKWHLGWDWARTGPEEHDVDYSQPIKTGPCAFGFDHFFGISASLDMPPYVYVEDDLVRANPDREDPGSKGFAFWRPGPAAPDFHHADVLPVLTQRAESWIKQQSLSGKPFFLYFPLPAPHTPILPAKEFEGKSGTNPYGDFCLMVDDTVGRIMTALEQNGVADNTIIIFTADNGCSPLADLPGLAKLGHNPSYVFRGHKADIYDGGHRIPLLVRWENGIRPGTTCDDTVCLSDLLATVADITGFILPDNAGEDSVSNLPLWQERPGIGPVREATVHHSIDGSFSIRQARWKLELCPGSGGWSSPRPGKECNGLPSIQLYDMSEDIGERVNVHDKHPEIVHCLTALLTKYVGEGRSTPGLPQPNSGPRHWPQLSWMTREGSN